MVENDYIMRLTHEMVRTWLKLLFGIDEEKEEETMLKRSFLKMRTAEICIGD